MGPITRREAEEAFASGDEKRVCGALARCTFCSEDWAWVQEQCAKLCEHPSDSVKELAVFCLGHLARTYGIISVDRLHSALNTLASHPSLDVRARQVLDELCEKRDVYAKRVREDVMWRVLREVVTDLSDLDEAIALCNVLYEYDFVIRARDGTAETVECSMRVASSYVERLFTGRRPGLKHTVDPGYEYAYWLRFFNLCPDEKERQMWDMWLQRLGEHPDVMLLRQPV